MSYIFKIDLSENEYKNYLNSLEHYCIMQTKAWADVKKDWKSTIVGMFDGEKLVAASLLLIRILPMGFKIIYSPRGFIIDYNNDMILSNFIDFIKNYAKKIGAYIIRIDPEIIMSENNNGQIKSVENGLNVLEKLKNAGFLHNGFAKDFQSYTQPRFYAQYHLFNKNNEKKSDDEILNSFDKKTRKYIGNYTKNRGIFFENSTRTEDIKDFYEISKYTETRQHILLRNQDYFERISRAFGEDCVLFFAKIDLDRFLLYCEDLKQKSNNNNANDTEQTQIDDDIVQAKKIIEKHGKIVTLSALLTIKSNDTAYLMYSGFNDEIFSKFRTTNQIRFEAMKYFRDLEKSCKIFSFMGIDGNLNDPLSEFKLKFNPEIIEYIGEFELPVKKLSYKLMKNVFPFFKHLYIRTILFFKKKK